MRQNAPVNHSQFTKRFLYCLGQQRDQSVLGTPSTISMSFIGYDAIGSQY